MSSDTMSISLGELAHDSAHSDRSLRLTMVHGEVLRVPKSARKLRVLSGQAWVSFEGKDIILDRGESLMLPRSARHEAIVSVTEHADALFFELE